MGTGIPCTATLGHGYQVVAVNANANDVEEQPAVGPRTRWEGCIMRIAYVYLMKDDADRVRALFNLGVADGTALACDP